MKHFPMKHILMGTAAVLLLGPHFAAAQSSSSQAQGQQHSQSQQQAQAGKPVAQTCLNDLQAFRRQMQKDGLWLSGYRTGYGWSGYGLGARGDQTAAHTGPGTGNTDARAGSDARAGRPMSKRKAAARSALRRMPRPAQTRPRAVPGAK